MLMGGQFFAVKTIVAIFLVCWSVTAFAQMKNGSAGASDAPIATRGSSHRLALVKGATLPDFVYTDFSGAEHRFSELHGQYRLIDFWATWCLPCVADLPSKMAVYKKYHRLGFEILSIDDEEREAGAAEKLIAKRAIPWPQARFDRSLVEQQFGVYQLPTFVLVDSHNVIVSVATDPSSELAGNALSRTLSARLSPSH
jgi:thiol-disulfide isomerase/thioredoxin